MEDEQFQGIHAAMDQFRELVMAFSSDCAETLQRSGHVDELVAANIVARSLLQSAWSIIGAVKLVTGNGEPDISQFLLAAKEMAETVHFDMEAAEAERMRRGQAVEHEP